MDAAEQVPSVQGSAPGEAGHDSLALVNTEFELPGGPYDGLPDAAAAREWLRGRGLLPARGAGIDAEELRRLRLLREAFREVFSAHIAGGRPAPEALERFNGALAAAPGVRELAWSGAGPALTVRQRAGARIDVALTLLAEDACELLTGPAAAKLSACGARGCTRLFIRAHAARRWCSDRCGNRVRAARHYADHGRVAGRTAKRA
ncbi:CGNR zinc finger domain-containing protein [Streptomyces xanthophaeus]|uniref:CGNR zinc finger domain-containing protein n=1 Tax=Streptomyces xanthophaeus TaxID=67385 RepID=UPI00365E8441